MKSIIMDEVKLLNVLRKTSEKKIEGADILMDLPDKYFSTASHTRFYSA